VLERVENQQEIPVAQVRRYSDRPRVVAWPALGVPGGLHAVAEKPAIEWILVTSSDSLE